MKHVKTRKINESELLQPDVDDGTVSLDSIGSASWPLRTWLNHHTNLDSSSFWRIGEEAAVHGISRPGVVVLLSVSVTESRPFSILDPYPFNGGSVTLAV